MSARRERLVGIALMLAAVPVFAICDVLTKHLAGHQPVPFVVAVRYLINAALLAAFLWPRHGRALIASQRTGLVLLRAFCLCGTSLFAGLALRHMPVAETTAIVFLAPFAVVGLSAFLLREQVSLPRWLSVGLGFAGVLLVVRPGGGLDPAGVIFALACALSTVGYVFLSRVLAASETTVALLFLTALTGLLFFSALLPWNWQGPPLTQGDVAALFGLGGFATFGHFLFTQAFRHAQASVLAPFNYLHLVWAALFGWLVFGQLPDGWGFAGMALIAGAGVMAALLPAGKARPGSG